MVLPISKSSSTSSTSSSVSSLLSYAFSDDTVKGGGGSSHGGSSHAGGANAVKFLCSYGGKILPRYPEKKLRYVGGDTRVLAVDRSISFSELVSKMEDLCGWGSRVVLRCQLPSEDLDALVTVSSDEDLANIIEEYDLANGINQEHQGKFKIRSFLLPIQPPQHQSKTPSPPASAAASPPSSDKGKSPFGSSPPQTSMASSSSHHHHHPRQMSPPHHQQRRPNHHHHAHLNHHHAHAQIPIVAASPYGYHGGVSGVVPVHSAAAASCRHPHNFPLAQSSHNQWQQQ